MIPTGISIMPARTLKRRDQQEVDVRLLELQFAGFLEPFDQRVFHFQLADEPDPIAEAMGHQQDEAMEIEAAVFELQLVEMEVHVPGNRRRPLRRVGGGGAGAGLRARAGFRADRQTKATTADWSGWFLSRLQNVAHATLHLEPCQLRPCVTLAEDENQEVDLGAERRDAGTGATADAPEALI